MPESARAIEGAAEYAPICPDGTSASAVGIADETQTFTIDGREYVIEAGDTVWGCLTNGIVYVPPFVTPALVELFWPDEWGLLPPG